MIFFVYLASYLIASFLITFICSCAFGLSDSLRDRREKDRRKEIRPNQSDRRVSNKFHVLDIAHTEAL